MRESVECLQIVEGLLVWNHRGQNHTGPQSFTHKFGIEKYLKIEGFL